MNKSMKLYCIIIADLSQIGNFLRALSSETEFWNKWLNSPNSRWEKISTME